MNRRQLMRTITFLLFLSHSNLWPMEISKKFRTKLLKKSIGELKNAVIQNNVEMFHKIISDNKLHDKFISKAMQTLNEIELSDDSATRKAVTDFLTSDPNAEATNRNE